MITKIAIEGAEFHAFHGLYSAEQLYGHTFRVFAEVTVDSLVLPDDEISSTINYETLYQIVKQEMNRTQKLLETVCYNILFKIKQSSDQISSCRVRIEKIGPQLGGKVEKSIVEIAF
jgi:dihydroneopterin aldolase